MLLMRANGIATPTRNPQPMPGTVRSFNGYTASVEPSDKYEEVIVGEPVSDEPPATEEDYLEEANYHEATEAYLQTIEGAPTAEDVGTDPDDLDTLSWDLLSVSSDPELVARMATYFDGMDSDEPPEQLRAKLRLLDVETYATVQIAAQAELRAAE